jgi:hypothetical protein
MALTSHVLETCVCTLRTHRPSRMGRLAMPFFYVCSSRPTGDHGARGSLEPSQQRGRIWSPPHRSGAKGHVATSKPTSVGRKNPVLLDTRRHVGAHLGWKAGPGATGHVTASEPTSTRRQDPVLLDMWWCVGARHIPYLDLKLVHGGTRSAGYRQWPSGPPQERLRTHRWGQLFGAPLGYLKLFA